MRQELILVSLCLLACGALSLPQNCKTLWTDTNACKECLPGFTLKGSECLKDSCPTGCSYCTDQYTCTSCYSGYYLFYNSCYQCSSNCYSCSSYSYCTSCQYDYYMSSNYCYKKSDNYSFIVFIVAFILLIVICAVCNAAKQRKRRMEMEKFNLMNAQVHNGAYGQPFNTAPQPYNAYQQPAYQQPAYQQPVYQSPFQNAPAPQPAFQPYPNAYGQPANTGYAKGPAPAF